MATKKKAPRKKNFLARLQSAPKIKSLRVKIKKQRAALKVLSTKYRRTIKSESRRLRS
jgi:hypothetical protein